MRPGYLRSQVSASSAVNGESLGNLPSWNLDDLYPGRDSPELQRDLERLGRETLAFEEKWKDRLAEEAAKGAEGKLGLAVQEYEALLELCGRIASFGGLLYYGNTSDPAIAKFHGDLQQKVVEGSTRLIFFPLELNLVDEALVDKALAEDPTFGRYRLWVLDLRKDKRFQLDEQVEAVFAETSLTGNNAWQRLFDETMASLRFKVDGEELPLEPTLNLMQSPDPETRRKGAEALAETLKANIRLFTLITNTLAKDKEISDRWRKFEDIADSLHLQNRVEREVVDALAAAVRDAYPRISHRYYAMKAKWLGMEKLNHWDRNAPLPETPEATIPWEEAKDTVLSAYGAFSPKMADIARQFFDKRWIDAPVRPGKLSGAFAHPTVPSAHPYVMLNYLGKPRDVMTLAHELGHGVHQVLSREQGMLMYEAPLTFAETASVFGEMLTFRSMLEKTSSKAERKAMLAQKVEDMINTVVRQIAFYEFERKVHTERRQQGELTAERLAELWMSVQQESLGPAVVLHPRVTRLSGPISRTSSICRSMSTPMPSAIAW